MQDLGQRFVVGGEDELEEIMSLYGEKLLRYATAILCDYYEAENIAQEVFLSAYQNRNTFDGNNLSAWLYKMTYHRCLNQRKRFRRILYFHEVRVKDISAEQDKGLSDETLRALQKLKPKERALVYGRIIEEQSYEELSLLTGSSPVALRKRYQRAKEKLLHYLNAEYGREESRYGQI
ncbi:RNA polymerase subunit sigma-24 [Ammoniphilus oxalaticus]|uniref:RNA polymerase subunit sigma-24 n=1 Tax=Ammoniphilus oxalaticus TaxID=66863 RepID=A0A419SKU6_9BACL|nr:RNA polymerase sigma factor [Ammoniphilus oxalaticus]RKD24570.1 RNA polymerase subunit sigma-24 [Ammoniphilus oxalaticus]